MQHSEAEATSTLVKFTSTLRQTQSSVLVALPNRTASEGSSLAFSLEPFLRLAFTWPETRSNEHSSPSDRRAVDIKRYSLARLWKKNKLWSDVNPPDLAGYT